MAAKAKSKTKARKKGSGKRSKKSAKRAQKTVKRKTAAHKPAQPTPAKKAAISGEAGQAIEVKPVHAEPLPWVKRSSLSIDQIERKIDIMIAAKEPIRPLSIQERYREKYGLELAVPEDYRKYEKLQLTKGDEDYLKATPEMTGYGAPPVGIGPYPPISRPGPGPSPSPSPGFGPGPAAAVPEQLPEKPAKPKGRKARKAAKRASRQKTKPKRAAKFFDMRTCRGYVFYLPAKFPDKGGFAKFIFVLLELLLYIFTFGILILIRGLTTLVYKRKDKKAAKRAAAAEAEADVGTETESESEQPTPA